MFKAISSAVSSVVHSRSGSPMQPDHNTPGRYKEYCHIADALKGDDVPVSTADCAACTAPCASTANNGSAGTIVEAGNAWSGKTYEEYVDDKYGDLGSLPAAVDTDWDSDLAGSGGPNVARVVVISTGKSNWVRDHTDEEDGLAYQINKYMSTLPASKGAKSKDGNPLKPSTYIKPSEFPPPSQPLKEPIKTQPALYSSSLVSQSDDCKDQTVLVFPDWKVVNDVENSKDGAKALYDTELGGSVGRAGLTLSSGGGSDGVFRKRSHVMPYRAIVLLCSHKTRDKRCGIAAPILRSALITCLEKNGVSVDESGAALAMPEGRALEEVDGTDAEREAAVGRAIEQIEGVKGGKGGQVGIFNINHLGGHRYAGVMLILFPSGAYLSYGRVSPIEIPRVVEETIMQGKVVPGLIRSGSGVTRSGCPDGGFLSW